MTEYVIPEQTTDGVAHVAYFDQRRQLSFTFDAEHGLMISVSSGGYAERPFALTQLYNVNLDQMKASLKQFEASCLAFIKTFEQFEESPRA